MLFDILMYISVGMTIFAAGWAWRQNRLIAQA
jgi:hypothetical protein